MISKIKISVVIVCILSCFGCQSRLTVENAEEIIDVLKTKDMDKILDVVSDEYGIRFYFGIAGLISPAERDWFCFSKQDLSDYFYEKKIRMDAGPYGDKEKKVDVKAIIAEELFLFEGNYDIIIDKDSIDLKKVKEMPVYPINIEEYYPEYKKFTNIILYFKDKDYYAVYFLCKENQRWKLFATGFFDSEEGLLTEQSDHGNIIEF